MAQDYFWADKHRDISQPADFNRARSPGNFLGVQVSNLEEVAVRLAHLRLALWPCHQALLVMLAWQSY